MNSEQVYERIRKRALSRVEKSGKTMSETAAISAYLATEQGKEDWYAYERVHDAEIQKAMQGGDDGDEDDEPRPAEKRKPNRSAAESMADMPPHMHEFLKALQSGDRVPMTLSTGETIGRQPVRKDAWSTYRRKFPGAYGDTPEEEEKAVRDGKAKYGHLFDLSKDEDGSVAVSQGLVDAMAAPVDGEAAVVAKLDREGLSEAQMEAAVVARRICKTFGLRMTA